jgi:hypothetical protein
LPEFAHSVKLKITAPAGGTLMDITGARTPEWHTENIDNPRRERDGRRRISPARFATAAPAHRDPES